MIITSKTSTVDMLEFQQLSQKIQNRENIIKEAIKELKNIDPYNWSAKEVERNIEYICQQYLEIEEE